MWFCVEYFCVELIFCRKDKYEFWFAWIFFRRRDRILEWKLKTDDEKIIPLFKSSIYVVNFIHKRKLQIWTPEIVQYVSWSLIGQSFLSYVGADIQEENNTPEKVFVHQHNFHIFQITRKNRLFLNVEI